MLKLIAKSPVQSEYLLKEGTEIVFGTSENIYNNFYTTLGRVTQDLDGSEGGLSLIYVTFKNGINIEMELYLDTTKIANVTPSKIFYFINKTMNGQIKENLVFVD